MEIVGGQEQSADAWNARDREGFFATYAEDCEVTAPGFSGMGRQGSQDFWSLWMGAFSDNQVIVRLLVIDGSNVAEEPRFEGTNNGPAVGPGWRAGRPERGTGTCRWTPSFSTGRSSTSSAPER